MKDWKVIKATAGQHEGMWLLMDSGLVSEVFAKEEDALSELEAKEKCDHKDVVETSSRWLNEGSLIEVTLYCAECSGEHSLTLDLNDLEFT